MDVEAEEEQIGTMDVEEDMEAVTVVEEVTMGVIGTVIVIVNGTALAPGNAGEEVVAVAGVVDGGRGAGRAIGTRVGTSQQRLSLLQL